jgi:hypothetical protein
MNNVKEFDKKTVTTFRQELDYVLKKFGKTSGLEIKAGNITYSASTVTVKVEGKVKGSQSREGQAVDMFTIFKFNDIIKVAQLGEVKIVGYKTRSPKYPYIVETVNSGTRYKLSESQVANRLSVTS